MSWIKRFFQNISQDQSADENYDNIPEQKHVTAPKEIKARVAYRYPKRNFRFPIDVDTRISHVQQEIQKEKERYQKQPGSHQHIHVKKSTNTPRTELNRWQEEEVVDEQPAVMKHTRKRPFRPTVIPSPIYGLKRSKEEGKEEPVVFELTPFFEEENSENDSVIRNTLSNEEKNATNHSELFAAEQDEIVHPGEVDDTQSMEEPKLSGDYRSEFRENRESFSPVVPKEDNDQPEEQPARQQIENESENTPVTNSKRDWTPKRNIHPNRGPIPYNVLMLKQDRENWRKRNAAKTADLSEKTYYQFPSLSLLNRPVKQKSNEQWIRNQINILNHTFVSFNVRAKVVGVSEGPSVTRFEIAPEVGVKVSKITNLTDDIKLSLAAKDIRIEAPIPGKHTIGIEVPNPDARPVFLREILEDRDFSKAPSPLTIALGLDITGTPIITDLKSMPHGLIAGATGSGKSVAINSFIVSLLYKARPDEVKLLLIDPKMVELSPYNEIPHLLSPVITNVKAATAALKWAVEEMERRYELFAKDGVRDIKRFNKRVKEQEKLPYIVIIIDELADLMMVAPSDVEEAIARIAQKARACGIHLLIATQRPSVDVITGLIKANIPTRIAFSVSSQVDSRTIIDTNGAERLLGKGDMLFLANGTSKPVRIQGAYISDEEIESVVEHVRQQGKPEYLFEEKELLKQSEHEETDELFIPACEYAVEIGHISTSALQRRFRIGYNRAARLVDMMEQKGMISEQKGSKPRDVLLTQQDLETLKQYS